MELVLLYTVPKLSVSAHRKTVQAMLLDLPG